VHTVRWGIAQAACETRKAHFRPALIARTRNCWKGNFQQFPTHGRLTAAENFLLFRDFSRKTIELTRKYITPPEEVSFL